ncbi:ArsR/SmtB family transcription factor [Streptomyces sp. NPDC051569]|uniref:ArsR/SmtB family transcription factor n=1 Tax=Streptomyces sp. NPDC051569 TaxID=3365661 RepID=UPI0037B37609
MPDAPDTGSDAGSPAGSPAAPRTSPFLDGALTLDPRTLRGLAHPLRMRLLAALRHYGPATASQLADRLSESSGATSYHLRQLATYGFVEDDPELGKGRERWWKAAQQGTVVDDSLHFHADPAVRGAMNTFLHELVTMHGQELSTWLGTRQDWPLVWTAKADFSDFTLRLTPDLLAELTQRIHGVIGDYSDLALPEGTEDAARIRVHLHAFPQAND